MSLSRSPSPARGGGWSSPGLTSPFESGKTTPRRIYHEWSSSTQNNTGSNYKNHGNEDNAEESVARNVNASVSANASPNLNSNVSWETAKARSAQVNGVPPSLTTRNLSAPSPGISSRSGFFARHVQRLGYALPSALSPFSASPLGSESASSNRRQYFADKEKLGRGRWPPMRYRQSRTGRICGNIGRMLWRWRLRMMIALMLGLCYILFYVSPAHRIYRRTAWLGGGSKFVIILAANQGGGVMEWKGPREWAIERDSVKNKKAYAKRWGYGLEIVDMSTKKRYAHEWRESWEKVDTIRNCMRKYPKAEWFWWLDLNTFIMEPSYSLQSHLFDKLENKVYRDINEYNPLNITHPFKEEFLDPSARSRNGDEKISTLDLLVPQDCGGFNLGSFFVHRSVWTDRLLDIWWDPVGYEQKHMQWEHKEQDALEHLYANQPWIRTHTAFIPQRQINSFPNGACSDNGLDARIHYNEHDRDFVVNMAGCEWGRDCWGEMYNFRELSNRLNRSRWEKFKDGISERVKAYKASKHHQEDNSGDGQKQG